MIVLALALLCLILSLLILLKTKHCESEKGEKGEKFLAGSCDTPYHCFIDKLNDYNFSDFPVDGDTSAQKSITSPVSGKTKNLLDTIMELSIHSYPNPPPNIDFSSGSFVLKDNKNNILASVSKGCGGKNETGYKFLACTGGPIWYKIPTQGYPYCMFGGDYPKPPIFSC